MTTYTRVTVGYTEPHKPHEYKVCRIPITYAPRGDCGVSVVVTYPITSPMHVAQLRLVQGTANRYRARVASPHRRNGSHIDSTSPIQSRELFSKVNLQ